MSKPKKSTTPEVSAAASALGSKGGRNGTGDAKRRDPSHYAITLAEARRAARTKRKMGKLG